MLMELIFFFPKSSVKNVRLITPGWIICFVLAHSCWRWSNLFPQEVFICMKSSLNYWLNLLHVTQRFSPNEFFNLTLILFSSSLIAVIATLKGVFCQTLQWFGASHCLSALFPPILSCCCFGVHAALCLTVAAYTVRAASTRGEII